MKKVAGLILGLIPVSVYAECVPVPDCASIGYTETSCDGGSIKCPFDTSKLKCIPCDSSFRFACTGENITAGVGNSCNGKYVDCECVSTDYISANGECICDTQCKVGAIYYSDGSCSSCLEENKTIVGVVVKDNEIVMSSQRVSMYWSNDGADIPALTNYTSNADTINEYSGFENTAAIVEYYGHDADTSATGIAAVYCYNYFPTGLETSKKMWYLPAAGEIYYYLHRNYNILQKTYVDKLGWSSLNYSFWSSTEYKASAEYISLSDGYWVVNVNKKNNNSVSCFIKI